MQSYLLFSLHGAMAAWGGVAVGEIRSSYRYPTKSAILGLLAAARGIKREDETALLSLQRSLGVAIRGDEFGEQLVDYHTAQVASRLSLKKRPHYTRFDELAADDVETILSSREYYCDVHYTIVLWARDNDLVLCDIAESLMEPEFALYLGRKSCPPGLPIKPFITEAETVQEALECYDKQESTVEIQQILGLNRLKVSHANLYADTDVQDRPCDNYRQVTVRHDHLLNRKNWQYAEREEKMIVLGE